MSDNAEATIAALAHLTSVLGGKAVELPASELAVELSRTILSGEPFEKPEMDKALKLTGALFLAGILSGGESYLDDLQRTFREATSPANDFRLKLVQIVHEEISHRRDIGISDPEKVSPARIYDRWKSRFPIAPGGESALYKRILRELKKLGFKE